MVKLCSGRLDVHILIDMAKEVPYAITIDHNSYGSARLCY